MSTMTSEMTLDAEPLSVSSDRSAAVECRQITKRYGAADSGTWALRGVDLEIYPGEMTLLVGPSGCGKTTLISIIAGLLNPTAGEVSVLGEPLHRMSNSRLVAFRGNS